MQQIQEMLLDMLKEIDEICEANDIRYFIDGGTCLGAVRHEGFIPWDNDADIVMTEDNYNKFVKAVNSQTEKTHRIVVDNRINREYGTAFGRYVNLDTTKITKNTPFWDDETAYAGLIIDIFILFPLPKTEPARTDYMELLALYDEFQNNTFRHTGRRTDRFVEAYKKAREESKKKGQVAVLEEMEAKLFNQGLKDDEYDDYVYLSSPRMFLRTFPKWMFDAEPVKIPFEGTPLPVSKYYLEEMRHFYGEDYYIIPGGSGQKVHVDLHSATIPYTYFVRDYMQFLDAADVKEKRRVYKESFVDEGFKRKIWDEDMIRFVSDRVRTNLLERIEEEKIDVLAETEAENWPLLEDLFEEFYQYQYAAAYKYWYRFIDLPDDCLYAAMMNLACGRGEYGKVSGFIQRYTERNGASTPALDKVQKMMDAIFAVSSARIYGRTEDERNALEYAESQYPTNREVRLERLKYDIITSDGSDAADLMKKAESLLEEYPGNVDIIKATGDIRWLEGDKAAATKIYDSIYDGTNDGLIRLDIEKKRRIFANA